MQCRIVHLEVVALQQKEGVSQSGKMKIRILVKIIHYKCKFNHRKRIKSECKQNPNLMITITLTHLNKTKLGFSITTGKVKSYHKLNSLIMLLTLRVKLKIMLHSLKICNEINQTPRCLIKNHTFYLKWTLLTMTMIRILTVLISMVRMLHSDADQSKRIFKLMYNNCQVIIKTQGLKIKMY